MAKQDAFTEIETKPDAKDRRTSRPVDPAQVARLFEKLPPHAIEAEMSLLGSMLIESEVIGDVVQVIRSGDDFFNQSHGLLFAAIVELYDKHSHVDLVTLHQLLIDREILDKVGGQDYLITLAESVPSAAHADYYARLVRDKAIIRRLIHTAGEVIYEAHNSPEQAQSILDAAEHRIFTIAERYEQSNYTSLGEVLDEALHFLSETGGIVSGLLTGYSDFDELTGGLQNGELLILAARPSMGKTALALNLAERLARSDHPVGIFSLEMSRSQLAQRLVAGKAGVDVQKLRRNMLNRDDLVRVRNACLELAHMPVFVDDVPTMTLMQLRAKSRRMRAKNKVQAIFIDYLQLVNLGFRTESRQLEVTEISRGLKALARELDIPVICMSQLNRGPEQREGHRPRLSDLRESGAIEQDADVVMLLHREDYYHKEDPNWADSNPDRVNVAELIIAKQRNGPTGVVRLTWDSASTTFRDHSFLQPPEDLPI